jgi:predicted TIM-barrel fold metal-dependent hydrolase
MQPLIALEEHFFAEDDALPDHVVSLYSEQFRHVPGVESKLKSLDSLRIAEMKKAGVTFQIISHAPGLSSSPAKDCERVNDYLASKIHSRKDLFRGLAVLPMSFPQEAANELRRTVKEHGFVGALVDNHITKSLSNLTGNSADTSSSLGVTYYESSFFHPIWEAAQELDVPIYLHPTFPTPEMRAHFAGSYVPGAGASIATSGWNWHSEVGTHVLRLFSGGVFDAFPRLKIIVGHFGEMLPFMLGRVNQLSNRWGERKRNFQAVYEKNLYITTSGVWGIEPMATIKSSTPLGNVLFSIDWPFAHAEWGAKFWEDLKKSNMYNEQDLDDIAWRNSAKLFGLDEAQILQAAERFGTQD